MLYVGSSIRPRLQLTFLTPLYSAKGHWKYYCDPAISLLITCIIFSSALPLGERPSCFCVLARTHAGYCAFLVKSASYILLQGVPSHISLEAVRDAIKRCPGVISLHEVSQDCGSMDRP
jgi:zinc transporter 1